MHNKKLRMIFIFIFFFLGGCTHLDKSTLHKNANEKLSITATDKNKKNKSNYRVFGKHYRVMKTSKNYEETGVASWYGRRFNKKRTSSGERYNMYKLTAAHKTLPLSTNLLVTNLKNGKKVVVKVNDRGPFVENRLIDLSYGAAKKLGILGAGLAEVNIKAITEMDTDTA